MSGFSSVTAASESVIPWRSSPAVRVGLSLGIATGLYGISFGALSIAAGLTFWQTQALSALMFTGGSQFAFIGVLSGGGTGAAALGAASLLGVRNTVYGMTMNALLRPALYGAVPVDDPRTRATLAAVRRDLRAVHFFGAQTRFLGGRGECVPAVEFVHGGRRSPG